MKKINQHDCDEMIKKNQNEITLSQLASVLIAHGPFQNSKSKPILSMKSETLNTLSRPLEQEELVAAMSELKTGKACRVGESTACSTNRKYILA